MQFCAPILPMSLLPWNNIHHIIILPKSLPTSFTKYCKHPVQRERRKQETEQHQSVTAFPVTLPESMKTPTLLINHESETIGFKEEPAVVCVFLGGKVFHLMAPLSLASLSWDIGSWSLSGFLPIQTVTNKPVMKGKSWKGMLSSNQKAELPLISLWLS